MNPGRELDKLVGEIIIGLNVFWVPVFDDYGYGENPPSAYSLPHYSTNIAAAWDVVEKIKKTISPDIHIRLNKNFDLEQVMVQISSIGGAYAPTAPHAICLAALKAIQSQSETKTQPKS